MPPEDDHSEASEQTPTGDDDEGEDDERPSISPEAAVDTVVNTARYNTGPRDQKATIAEAQLRIHTIAHGRLSVEEFEEALATAIREDRLLEAENGEYSVPDAERTITS